MNLFRIITVTFFIFSVLSCDNSRDVGIDCGPFESTQFVITDMKVKLTDIEDAEYYVGAPLHGNELMQGDTVGVDGFVMELISTTQRVTHIEKKQKPSFEFSFIRKAHACSPPPPYTNEKVAGISITALSDFSDDYLSGSSLNEVFDVTYNDYDLYATDSNNQTIAYNLDEFVDLNPNGGLLTQLKLNSSPTLNMNHQFEIRYELEGGETYTITTPEIVFE